MALSIKKSLICKNIEQYAIDTALADNYLPVAGDVALFKVICLGKHTRVSDETGRNRLILPGDYLLCAFGNRYATNQIEGYVPDSIQSVYHMLGQGGVVGIVKSLFKPIEKQGPTTLQLIGYATNENGEVLNTKQAFEDNIRYLKPVGLQSKVILSVGTSMDSGKTTTAGYLCRGLSRAGYKTAYMKLTGTVFYKDPEFAVDCGANLAIDFSHFGFPSTYMCSETELLQLYYNLLKKLEPESPDFIVIEIADGLLQRETAMLLRNERFMETVFDVIFSAGDSMGLLYGLQWLKKLGITPFAVGGCFTISPLLMQEVREHVNVNILPLDQLENPESVMSALLTSVQPIQSRAHVA